MRAHLPKLSYVKNLLCSSFLVCVSGVITSVEAWVEDTEGFTYQVEFHGDEGVPLTEADRIYYCTVMEEASKFIWETTNGSHYIHSAHFYYGGTESPTVEDVGWGRSNCTPTGGSKVNMCDYKMGCSKQWFTESDGSLNASLYCRNPAFSCQTGSCYCGGTTCLEVERVRGSTCVDSDGQSYMHPATNNGWVVAHEIGHYMYDLNDEYIADWCTLDPIHRNYYVCASPDGYSSMMGAWGRIHFCDHNTHLATRPFEDIDGNILTDLSDTPYMATDSSHPAGIWNDIVSANSKFTHHLLAYDSTVGYSAVPSYPSEAFNCVWHTDGAEGPSQDALVLLDKSGSMDYVHPMITGGPTAMSSAAAASVSYHNQGEASRLVGITSFDTDTNNVVLYGPKGADLVPLSISAGGNTDLCKAIREGADLIRQRHNDLGVTEPNGQQILLSDGRPTIAGSCDSLEDVLDAALYACSPPPGQTSVVTSTVAFGEADHELLRKVAEVCGGVYKSLDVAPFPDGQGGSIMLTAPLLVQTGLVRQGKLVRSFLEAQSDDRPIKSNNTRSIAVPPGTSSLVVEWIGDGFVYDPVIVYGRGGEVPPRTEVSPSSSTANCRFENLAFELESPVGATITTGDKPIANEAAYLTKTITMRNPEPGTWIARVIPAAEYICIANAPKPHEWGEYDPRIATVVSLRNRILTPEVSLETHATGRNAPVAIRASLDIYPNTRAAHIFAAAVVSRSNFREVVPLYDNGAHGDDEAADGIYGGTFNATGNVLEPGSYQVVVVLSANKTTAVPAQYSDGVLGLGAPEPPPIPTVGLRKETSLVLRDCLITPERSNTNECVPDSANPRNHNEEDICKFSLQPGHSYQDLRVDTTGLIIGRGDVLVNLGLDVEVSNVRVTYNSKSVSSAILFDASVNSGALPGPRDVAVSYGRQVVSSKACPDMPATRPPGFKRFDLELGYFMGGLLLSDNFPIDSELAYGVRFGFGRPLSDRLRWTIEPEIMLASPFDHDEQHGFLTGANLLFTLESAIWSRINPFMSLGIGYLDFSGFSSVNDRSGMAPIAAVGLKFHYRPQLNGRIEARYLNLSDLIKGDEKYSSNHYSLLWGVDVLF